MSEQPPHGGVCYVLPSALADDQSGCPLNQQKSLKMHASKTVNFKIIQLGALAFLWLCGTSYAHPFHTTTAEMEFNSAAGRFEVALKIPASDFEHMVLCGMAEDGQESPAEKTTKLPTKLKAEEITKYASRYLAKHYSISLAGQPCRFEWVGTEDEQQSKWIYFELILPSDRYANGKEDGDRVGELRLTNRVLCDRNNDQFNTVVLLMKAGRVALKTHAGDDTVALPRW